MLLVILELLYFIRGGKNDKIIKALRMKEK